MNSAVSLQQPHANLMIAIDTVDSAALTGIIRALRVIIEARKGQLDTAEAELQERGARGNFREMANRPQKRSAFGNCTKIGGLWPDKYGCSPAAKCKNVRRGSFILHLPSLHITRSPRRRGARRIPAS